MELSSGAIVHCPLWREMRGVCVNYTDDVITSYDCNYKSCGNMKCQLKTDYPIGKKIVYPARNNTNLEN